jgi:hypothetical protein
LPSALTTEELLARLERRVLGPEGQGHRAFLLTEVCLANRRADAISVGLWHSRGQHIDGYEIKSNRQDWLREYEDHQKAEPAMELCDHFWLVTNPDVLMPDELPEKWGLLVSNGKGRHLKVQKPAPDLRPHSPSLALDRTALVALLRRVEMLQAEDRHALREEAIKEGEARVERNKESMRDRIERAEARATEHDEAWEAFLNTAGLRFWDWRPTPENLRLFGEIVSALREGGSRLDRLRNDLQRAQSAGGDVAEKMGEALKLLEDHPTTGGKSDVF